MSAASKTSAPKYARKVVRKSPIGKDHPLAKMHIRVGIEGQPKSVKRIPRLKLTPQNVESIFGVTPYYLKDDTGNIFFPKDWRTKCIGPPVLYTIKEKPARYTEIDPHEDLNYDGECTLSLIDVPEDIDADMLNAYLRFALEDEDPIYGNVLEAISESEKKMKEVEEKMQNIPFLQIREATSVKEEQAERLMMSNFLKAEQKRIASQLEHDQLRMKKLKRQRDAETYRFQRVHLDRSTKLAIWQVLFDDHRVGIERGSILLNKDDWFDFRVFRNVSGDEKCKYIVVKGETLPPEVDPKYEINVRSIKVVRRRTGKGMLRMPGHKYVEGTWKNGVADGVGRIHSKFFAYEGDIRDGLMSGEGELRTRYGSVYRGPVELKTKHGDSRPLLRKNEYHDGTPEGRGTMQFADGSHYEGDFRDGRICGKGVYRRADGTIFEGEFRNGVLHGQGTVKEACGRTYAGTWIDGKLEGRGSMTLETNGKLLISRRGMFAENELDGIGDEWRPDRRYSGMWKNGRSHGIGTLMYDGHLKTTRASASNDPLATLKPCTTYGRLLDATWINGSFGVYGSEMHATKRRPDGVMYFANHYMSKRYARAHAFGRDSVGEMHARIRDGLRSRKELLALRQRKYQEAKNAFVDAHNAVQKDADARLLRKERAQKEAIREKKRAEAERKRKQKEEEAAVFAKMREAISGSTSAKTDG